MKLRTLMMPLLALMMLVLSACVIEQTATTSETLDSYAKPDVLVDTEWVQANLDNPDVQLIALVQQEDYDAGHLPGAKFLSLQSLTNPDDPIRGQILTQDALSTVMSSLGVEADDTVVFYDASSNLLATRAYWAVKYYQHEDVRVYNGGSAKWVADGNELSTDVPSITPSEYSAGEADPSIRTTWQYVVDHTGDPSTLFCDTRGPEEYTGTDVRSERGGHVPGAINVEWSNAVNEDGTFKEAAVLDELYSKAGFERDKEIITYCQTGVRGAHTWFVLRELLGYESVRNYDGSWEEYGNNETSTIEQ